MREDTEHIDPEDVNAACEAASTTEGHLFWEDEDDSHFQIERQAALREHADELRALSDAELVARTTRADTMDDSLTDDDPPQVRRLIPIRWSELGRLPDRQPLVKGVLYRGDLSVLYGASGVGKSFIAIDLGARVSLGWEWHGQKVRRGRVGYVAPDGGLGVKTRFDAWEQHHGANVAEAELFVFPEPIDLRGDADADLLLKRFAEIAPGFAPDLIIIDTLSRSLGAGNENASDAMGAFVRNCDKLRLKTGAHVAVIHHTGKNADAGARGHSLLRAALDTEIEVEGGGSAATATVRKQRDGRSGETFGFQFLTVRLGMDEDGDPIESRVAIAGTPAAVVAPRSRKADDGLPVLRACIADHGEARDDLKGAPNGSRSVTLECWRDALCQAGVINPEAGYRTQFKRIRVTLEKQRLIGTSGKFVWCVT